MLEVVRGTLGGSSPAREPTATSEANGTGTGAPPAGPAGQRGERAITREPAAAVQAAGAEARKRGSEGSHAAGAPEGRAPRAPGSPAPSGPDPGPAPPPPLTGPGPASSMACSRCRCWAEPIGVPAGGGWRPVRAVKARVGGRRGWRAPSAGAARGSGRRVHRQPGLPAGPPSTPYLGTAARQPWWWPVGRGAERRRRQRMGGRTPSRPVLLQGRASRTCPVRVPYVLHVPCEVGRPCPCPPGSPACRTACRW
jgi:hypothetical protein